MRLPCLLLLLLFTTIKLFAQDSDSLAIDTSGIKNKFNQFWNERNQRQLNKDTILHQLQLLSNEQFKTEMALERDKQRALEDEMFAMQHRWRSFSFQYTASIIIFILVIIIVLSGLVFSAWQFRIAMKQMVVKEAVAKAITQPPVHPEPVPPKLAPAQADAQNPPANQAISALKNELEVSATGIKVNSSVLGVIILVLSIVFFYFYLLYVYPVKYIPATAVPVKADTAATAKTKLNP